jgi:predicted RNase H-like HicB family nuclease
MRPLLEDARMTLCVHCERDEDGRWLAKMPGAIAYGETIEEAMAKAEALALQILPEVADEGLNNMNDARLKSDGPAGASATE